MPIIIGIVLLLSWTWGADIGVSSPPVGVTSIVIGLAVQTAVGPVIAGLLLLFAQPSASDRLDTTSEAVGFITACAVGMIVNAEDGGPESADYIGTSALTAQRMLTGNVALTDPTIRVRPSRRDEHRCAARSQARAPDRRGDRDTAQGRIRSTRRGCHGRAGSEQTWSN